MASAEILELSMRKMEKSEQAYDSVKIHSKKSVLIVGSERAFRAFEKEFLHHLKTDFHVAGFLELGDHDEEYEGKTPMLGHLDNLPEVLDSFLIDEVLFIAPLSLLAKIEGSIAFCREIGLKTKISLDFPRGGKTKMSVDEIAGYSFITLDTPKIGLLAMKRVVDIVLSLFILVLISPLLMSIAIAVKLTSRGPVFFRQRRRKINGKPFTVLKFRTMVDNAEKLKSKLLERNEMSGPVFKVSNDPRVTPLGRFLRKYSLDEFPQFINVLLGDMSIVGPRPLPLSEIEKDDVRQRRRLSMKPGITCLWQVNGRNKIDFDEWIQLDLSYIDNWSLGKDLMIILKTIPAFLGGSGV